MQLSKLPGAHKLPAAVNMGDQHSSDLTTQHRRGPNAASAGRPGTGQKPALLQLDELALNEVLKKLEPKPLALAGAREYSACLHVCVEAGG